MPVYTDPQTGETHETEVDGQSSSVPFLVLIALCVGGVLMAWLLVARPVIESKPTATAPIIQPHAPSPAPPQAAP